MLARIIESFTPPSTSNLCRLYIILVSFVRQDVPFRRTFGRHKHIKSARINASSRLLRSPAVNSCWHRNERPTHAVYARVHTPSCFMQKLRVCLVNSRCLRKNFVFLRDLFHRFVKAALDLSETISVSRHCTKKT